MKVAINGFGRIGKLVFRALLEKNPKDINIVAINELGSVESSAHLLKYDSVHGILKDEISSIKNGLKIGKHKINFYSERDPNNLPWKSLKVDVVLECSGVFTSKEKAISHLNAGAKKVIISAPASNVDATIVQGVNNDTIKKNHNVISNGSCTTNCLAPLAMVLDEKLGIESGFMTTIHSYTGDQRTVDQTHSDFRRARAAAESMIPTSTGAAKAVGKVIPELNGKLTGMAFRVPTMDVSVVDLTVKLEKKATYEEICSAMKSASESGPMAGVLGYTEDQVVSQDFVGETRTSVFDAGAGIALNDNFVKVVSWYDNEIGYSTKIVDLIEYADTL